MLLSAYQRLDDGQKLLLADVFANPAFNALIDQTYTEIQISVLNIENIEGESDEAFIRRYKVEQQRLHDIDDLKKFVMEGREEFQILVQAQQNQG